MATIGITTTADQDSAVKYATDQYNAVTVDVPLTPVQYAKQRIDQFLNGLVERWRSETRLTKADAYAKASDADKATIDAILVKYQ